jgi:hypothetical protein
MNTQDIEDTLREFAVALNNDEEKDGNIPQGFANRLTALANDMKRHREYCEVAQPDQAKKLALLVEDSDSKS